MQVPTVDIPISIVFLPSRSDIPLVGFSSTMKHRLLHPTLLVDISSLVLWDSRFVLGHSYTPPKSNIEPQTTAIFETIFPVQSCIASGLIPSKNRVHLSVLEQMMPWTKKPRNKNMLRSLGWKAIIVRSGNVHTPLTSVSSVEDLGKPVNRPGKTREPCSTP